MTTLHSLLRWVVALDLPIAALLAVAALRGLPEWRPIHKIVALAALIAVDLQLVIGAALWAYSPIVQAARLDMGAAMKAPALRFFAVEHTAMMVLALVAVHVGYAKAKRAADGAAAHRAIAWGYGVAAVLVAIGTPWPWRAIVGRPLLPW